MLVLGITGQSGAGKGELCEYLRSKGVPCLDTDITAREVVKHGTECLSSLVAHFGKEILTDSGEMDRKKVASIVFSDKEQLEFLTRTTHKYIIEEIKEWLFRRELDGEKIVGIDAPQLFDAGADFYCNFIVAVLASEKVRLSRITVRDGIDEKAALARIKSQKDDDFFKERCDFVIYNNTSLADLSREAERLYIALSEKTEYFD